MRQGDVRGLIFVALAAIFISFFAGTSHALNINIDPPRAELILKPGEEKSGFVIIQNKDETGSLHIKAYVQDLVYLPDGSNDFLPVGSTPWSLKDYIKIGPTEFDILAGKQEMVRYVVSLPKGANGGYYGVIFFEATVPPSEFLKTGANINVRLGTIMLVTVENTGVVKVRMKAINVDTGGKEQDIKISCTVFNEGNVIARPNGTVKFIDMNKSVVAEVPINKDKGGVLPNTARTYLTDYKEAIKKGAYYAQVVLDYGGASLLGGQTKFEVK